MNENRIADLFCLKNSLNSQIRPLFAGNNHMNQKEFLEFTSLKLGDTSEAELIEFLVNEENEVLLKLTNSNIIQFTSEKFASNPETPCHVLLSKNEHVLFDFHDQEGEKTTSGYFYYDANLSIKPDNEEPENIQHTEIIGNANPLKPTLESFSDNFNNQTVNEMKEQEKEKIDETEPIQDIVEEKKEHEENEFLKENNENLPPDNLVISVKKSTPTNSEKEDINANNQLSNNKFCIKIDMNNNLNKTVFSLEEVNVVLNKNSILPDPENGSFPQKEECNNHNDQNNCGNDNILNFTNNNELKDFPNNNLIIEKNTYFTKCMEHYNEEDVLNFNKYKNKNIFTNDYYEEDEIMIKRPKKKESNIIPKYSKRKTKEPTTSSKYEFTQQKDDKSFNIYVRRYNELDRIIINKKNIDYGFIASRKDKDEDIRKRKSRKNSLNNETDCVVDNKKSEDKKKSIVDTSEQLKKKDDKICRICLGVIKKLTKLNKCEHEFCFACITEWGKVSNTCPICKNDFSKLTNKNEILNVRKKRLKIEEEQEEPWMYSCSSNCMICKKSDNEYLLLVCDKCHYYVCHTFCDNLDRIPDGEWICIKCRKKNPGYTETQEAKKEVYQIGTRNRKKVISDSESIEDIDESKQNGQNIEVNKISSKNMFIGLKRRRRDKVIDLDKELNELKVKKLSSEKNTKKEEDHMNKNYKYSLKKIENHNADSNLRNERGSLRSLSKKQRLILGKKTLKINLKHKRRPSSLIIKKQNRLQVPSAEVKRGRPRLKLKKSKKIIEEFDDLSISNINLDEPRMTRKRTLETRIPSKSKSKRGRKPKHKQIHYLDNEDDEDYLGEESTNPLKAQKSNKNINIVHKIIKINKIVLNEKNFHIKNKIYYNNNSVNNLKLKRTKTKRDEDSDYEESEISFLKPKLKKKIHKIYKPSLKKIKVKPEKITTLKKKRKVRLSKELNSIIFDLSKNKSKMKRSLRKRINLKSLDVEQKKK